MALKTCKECGKEVSSKAKQCPGCGAPVKSGMGLGKGCLVVIAVGFLASALLPMLAGSPKKPSGSPRPSESRASTVKEDSLEARVFPGEQFEMRTEPREDAPMTLGPPDPADTATWSHGNGRFYVLEEKAGWLRIRFTAPKYAAPTDPTGWVPKDKTMPEEQWRNQQWVAWEKQWGEVAGPKPVPSGWDGSVSCAKDYLKQTLKDPDSLKDEKWFPVQATSDGYWSVKVAYRAKNSYGAYNPGVATFYIRKNKVVRTEPYLALTTRPGRR